MGSLGQRATNMVPTRQSGNLLEPTEGNASSSAVLLSGQLSKQSPPVQIVLSVTCEHHSLVKLQVSIDMKMGKMMELICNRFGHKLEQVLFFVDENADVGETRQEENRPNDLRQIHPDDTPRTLNLHTDADIYAVVG